MGLTSPSRPRFAAGDVLLSEFRGKEAQRSDTTCVPAASRGQSWDGCEGLPDPEPEPGAPLAARPLLPSSLAWGYASVYKRRSSGHLPHTHPRVGMTRFAAQYPLLAG